ncbi:MAG TPA: holo-ACP synthase [Planctomycetota bacterium]|nr:holo-ACP synthase [Planctomycetota bacterium]
MIIGIGIDLVEVKRVKALLNKPNLGRIFTAQEIKYCRSKANPAESFAARFAAKEAFLKAIGTGWGTAQSPNWNEIEVVAHPVSRIPHPKAVPLQLSGKAQKIAGRLGVKHTQLSLTHTKDYAVAVVILEGM